MSTAADLLGPGTTVRARLPVGARLGAIGLAIPLIGGRWGSYIGIEPIYLADLLLMVATISTYLAPKNYPKVRFSRVFWLFWTATVAFILVALLLGTGDFVTRVRDLIPWYYLLLIPAVVQWTVSAGQHRVLNYLTLTLLAHAAWSMPALAGMLPPVDAGWQLFGQPLFSERPDVDVPLLAAAVVLVLHRWGARGTTLIFTLCAAGAAAAQTSRAALVGGVLAIVVFCRVRGHLNGISGLLKLLGAGTIAAVVVLVLLPTLSARTADLFDMGALARAGLYGSSDAAASGDGTAGDRYSAWRILLEHYADEGYPPLGDGAGTEIIRNTQTVRYFGGDVETRAPHSWWVHVLVRTGYVGTVLWIGLLIGGARPTGGADRPAPDFLTAMGALMITSVLLSSSFGVVIEAPFGAQLLLVGVALFGLRAQGARNTTPPTPDE